MERGSLPARCVSVSITVCMLSCLLLVALGCAKTEQGTKAIPKQISADEFKASIDKTKMMGGGDASKTRGASGPVAPPPPTTPEAAKGQAGE